ncbi:MAG: polysaccharide biosynthesis protein [Acidimicrobiales bacterium]
MQLPRPADGGERFRAAVRRFSPYARLLELTADLAVVVAAVVTAVAVRSLDPDTHIGLDGVAAFAGLAAIVFVGVGWIEGLYRRRSIYGSFDEVASLLRTSAVTVAFTATLNRWAFDRLVPITIPFIAGMLALCGTGAVRYAWRLVYERTLIPRGAEVKRTLVIGAGEGAHQLITAMRRDGRSPYQPVGIIDDDPHKRRLRIGGVPVVGDRSTIGESAHQLGATAVVIAIPSASAELIRQLTQPIRHAGLDALVLPPVSELLGQGVGVSDVRTPTEADLLGRHEVDTDIDAIAGYITGRRVLVTGAGGSIGSELCRQLHRFAPDRLVLLDRDESALHGTQLLLEGRALLDSPDVVVADIRDRDRLYEVFERARPQVVFHAAALKHLPLLELHPSEGVKTNIWGTQHVLDAAASVDVDRFVNVSTDKAADPTSVLGYTKRIAERLTAAQAQRATGTYLSVRFGNVLGSRGSVLSAFRSQIEVGGPVTVTHPDVTRFFMTVEEAVQLVIQAGAMGGPGEALVLDMGEPVRILDVARQLVASSQRRVEIVFTGLRPGEKLREVLHAADESPRPSGHRLISTVDVSPLPFDNLSAALDAAPGPLIASLARMATTT